MIRFILMDIEGTTTSIDFVHQVLFPYASEHLEQYVQKHLKEEFIQTILREVKVTVDQENGEAITDQQAIAQLLDWIKEDRKHGALKRLQGHIWRDGYVSGQYKAHLYADVLPQIKAWKNRGIQMGIYSSGSVAAQQLLFKYSEEGDLSSYLSAFFDTSVGHKREISSYLNIQHSLAIPASEILFLSDVEAELNAAQAAGFQTIQLVRPGTSPGSAHHTVSTFTEIPIP